MTSLTFGPNSGTDVLWVIERPEDWITANGTEFDLDAWHFVLDPNPLWIGPNTYEAVREVGLEHLPLAGVELYISFEAQKEHDKTGEKNQVKWDQVIRPRVEAAGGLIAGWTIDEPITSTVPGRWGPPGHTYPWWTWDEVIPHLVRSIKATGLPSVWYEGYPQQSESVLTQSIIRTHDEVGPLLKRFVLDVDGNALRSGDNLSVVAQSIRSTCEMRGIEFAISAMPPPVGGRPYTTSESFLAAQRLWVARLAPLTPHLVIESWNEAHGLKLVPDAVPHAQLLAWADRTYNGEPEEPRMSSETKIRNAHQASLAMHVGSSVYNEVVAIYAKHGKVPVSPVPVWPNHSQDGYMHAVHRCGGWQLIQSTPPPNALDGLAALEDELSGQ